jgi:hypothetical protein
VGFHIYNSRKISKNDFECHFNLWGNGVPNWKFEEKLFYAELNKEWTTVQRGRNSVFNRIEFPRRSLAVASDEPQRASVFNRLSFPSNADFNRPVNSPLIGPSFGKYYL